MKSGTPGVDYVEIIKLLFDERKVLDTLDKIGMTADLWEDDESDFEWDDDECDFEWDEDGFPRKCLREHKYGSKVYGRGCMKGFFRVKDRSKFEEWVRLNVLKR